MKMEKKKLVSTCYYCLTRCLNQTPRKKKNLQEVKEELHKRTNSSGRILFDWNWTKNVLLLIMARDSISLGDSNASSGDGIDDYMYDR